MTDALAHLNAYPLRVVCACGHIDMYDDTDALKADGGDLVYHSHSDLFAATCPTCREQRPVRAGRFSWDDGTEMCLALGAFEDGYDPLDADLEGPYDPNRTNFELVADPVYIARQRLDPTCLRCGGRVTEEDRRADAEAPEIGYEYYECPDCGNQMRPEAIETQRDD